MTRMSVPAATAPESVGPGTDSGNGTGHRNTLYLEDGSIFLLTDSSTKGASASVATSDAMHTYRITVDTTTHAMTVSRDGVDTLTGTAFTGSDPSTPTIYFGDSSGAALGTSAWEYVGHNATSCP